MRSISEIIGRIEQGFCEAILCRDEGGIEYVVKTRTAGATALVKEVIAGHIGQALGLPIPPFDFCYIEPAVARYMAHPEAAVLADCPGFASREIKDYVQFGPPLIPEVDPVLRAKVLLLDWWTMNGDRTNGNPNLLWVAHEGALHVIDHNLAFDAKMTAAEFWASHIFRADSAQLANLKANMSPIMHNIMRNVWHSWQQMPEPWTEATILTLADVEKLLGRIDDPAFWEQA